MFDVPDLVDGYKRFMAGRYQEQAEAYRAQAEGQTPKVMVVSCCDSRVDPGAIFDAGPGELFVVRNVANIVPPCETSCGYHGTSSALEFAVTALKVETILVMGHGRCGGVKAFIESGEAPAESGATSFISEWISILGPARPEAEAAAEGQPAHVLQREMEYAGVRNSLKNLESFPFVKERMAAGTLKLRGAWFDVAEGQLMVMDPATGRFGAAA